ncbi:penicillin-binding transpeptidase domain-containing protein, partial [Escherichia coli]
ERHARKEAMRNRTITDVFEPGSTVKPMVVMTALPTWRGCGKTRYSIPVPYRINRSRKSKDVARYSELTLTGVLQKSSNVGVSKLASGTPEKKRCVTVPSPTCLNRAQRLNRWW